MEEDKTTYPYTIADDKYTDLERRFTYHKPKGDQPDRYLTLRNQAFGLATMICQLTPPSREQSLALTKLEEAVMWSNASIARNE